MYVLPRPFEGDSPGNWSLVDLLLAELNRPVEIRIQARATEGEPLRRALAEYERQLALAGGMGRELDPRAALAEEERGVRFRDMMADEVRRALSKLRDSLESPLLQFCIEVTSPDTEAGEAMAHAVAQVGFGEGQYQVRFPESADDVGDSAPRSGSSVDWAATLKEAYTCATVSELVPFLTPPLADQRRRFRTIRRTSDTAVRAADGVTLGEDAELQEPLQLRVTEVAELQPAAMAKRMPAGPVEISLVDLTKHLFVTGMPGSGKTNLMKSLLLQLRGRQHPVPFLVIESAKTEYRDLQSQLDGCRVISVGRPDSRLLRFNPLASVPGVSVEEQILSLISCFQAAFPEEPVVLMVLEQALRQVFNAVPEALGEPCLSDLYQVASALIESFGYGTEITSNLRGAIANRLGFLTQGLVGATFDCRTDFPSRTELFTTPTILELDALTPERGCLVSLLLLNGLRQFWKGRLRQEREPILRHLTVIEEAHNVVGGPPSRSAEGAQTEGASAEFVARMLAEVRALGLGLVIVDQLPSAVADGVVKNTGTKIAGRLDSTQDREILAGAMLLGDAEERELARLDPGFVFAFKVGMHRGRRVRIPELLLKPAGRPVLKRRGVAEESRFAIAELQREAHVFNSALDGLKQELKGLHLRRIRYEARAAAIRDLHRRLSATVGGTRRLLESVPYIGALNGRLVAMLMLDRIPLALAWLEHSSALLFTTSPGPNGRRGDDLRQGACWRALRRKVVKQLGVSCDWSSGWLEGATKHGARFLECIPDGSSDPVMTRACAMQYEGPVGWRQLLAAFKGVDWVNREQAAGLTKLVEEFAAALPRRRLAAEQEEEQRRRRLVSFHRGQTGTGGGHGEIEQGAG